MNEQLILDLKTTINQVKWEIKEKEQELDELIDQYQELSEIPLIDTLDELEN